MLLWHSALISISATLIIQCNQINCGFSDFREQTNSDEHFSEHVWGAQGVLGTSSRALKKKKGKAGLPSLKEFVML